MCAGVNISLRSIAAFVHHHPPPSDGHPGPATGRMQTDFGLTGCLSFPPPPRSAAVEIKASVEHDAGHRALLFRLQAEQSGHCGTMLHALQSVLDGEGISVYQGVQGSASLTVVTSEDCHHLWRVILTLQAGQPV